MFDIVTLGSANVDVFVKAKGESVSHEHHQDVCFNLGAKILIDNLFTSTGGGATNSAAAFKRLGFKTGCIAKIGKDHNGELILKELKKENIEFLGSTGDEPTGYSVILTGIAKDRTILVYKGINNNLKEKEIKKFEAKWLYVSSMIGDSFETAKNIIKKHKKTGKYAFNPSLYLAEKGLAELAEFVNDCDLLVLNKEEAIALTGGKITLVNHLLKVLSEHAKNIIITDGENGATATDGKMKYTLIPTKVSVVETTGAGDAFASAAMAGMMKTNNLKTAMQWGYAEAVSVIQYIGAKNKLLTITELMKAMKQPAKVIVEDLKC